MRLLDYLHTVNCYVHLSFLKYVMENYEEGGEGNVFRERDFCFQVQFTFGLKYNINNHLCYYQIAKKYLF